jgi:uncharacterized protein YndB with AHSA1/START domain
MEAARPEAHPPGWTVLQLRRTFKAPRELVFRAWIDPELLRQWLNGPGGRSPHAEVDARVGGEFRITSTSRLGELFAKLPGQESEFVQMVGRYLEISPPERLVFTMGWEDFPTVHMRPDATTVTVEFHEAEEGTELVLTHERQPNRRIRGLHRWGWKGSLRNLDRVLTGSPRRH